MSRIVVVIPNRPLSLANSRMHWSKRMVLVRERRAWVANIGRAARMSARMPVADGPRRVSATIMLSGTFFDPDGATAALKPEIDGLCDAGLLRGDRTADLKLLPVEQVRAKSRLAQGVVWVIEECE